MPEHVPTLSPRTAIRCAVALAQINPLEVQWSARHHESADRLLTLVSRLRAEVDVDLYREVSEIAELCQVDGRPWGDVPYLGAKAAELWSAVLVAVFSDDARELDPETRAAFTRDLTSRVEGLRAENFLPGD